MARDAQIQRFAQELCEHYCPNCGRHWLQDCRPPYIAHTSPHPDFCNDQCYSKWAGEYVSEYAYLATMD
jgi:hypothetical protein